MHRWVWVCALSAALSGVLVGASAQNSPELKSFTATLYPEGVVVEWRLSHASDNAGFHVYRGDVCITPDLVAGWAWSAKGFTPDRRYTWLDPEGTGNDVYRVVALDAKGNETSYGPVGVEPASMQFVRRPMAVLVSELGLTHGETRWNPAPPDLGDARYARVPVWPRHPEYAEQFRQMHRRVQRHHPTPPTQEEFWLLAEKSAVKIAVREEGWYRVSQPALVAAGLPQNVRPSSLRMFAEGEEVPLRVVSAAGSRFGPQDSIEFYGTPLDTPWSGTKIYWLFADEGRGARIDKSAGIPHRATDAVSFPNTVEFKQRSVYFAALRNGDAENFFGPVVSSTGVDVYLRATNVDGAAQDDAILEVALQGALPGTHDVLVQFNGANAGRVQFEGTAIGEAVLALSPTAVLEGDNQIRCVAQGAGVDVSIISEIKLTYAHLYRADGNQLQCTAPGRELVSVAGFTSNSVRVFDITDPKEPVEIHCMVRRQGETYTLLFSVNKPGERKILAFAAGTEKTPAAVTANTPSHLRRITSGADFVIITHGDFAASVAPLKALREAQRWHVVVVDVQDIFDEFNYGHSSPYAIKAFLSLAAQRWHTPPSHVLLVGDASFDPRDYLGLGYLDFVPTKLVDAWSMETASDDWYADLNDDGLPELAIGRLPVRTSAETAVIVGKLVTRENVLQTNSVLLVADAPNGGVDFSAANATLGALVPAPFEVHPIVRSPSGGGAARAELLARWSQGPRFVNYYGWSFINFWESDTFTAADVPSLGNGPDLPVVAGICNLNCFFHDLFTEGIGETLLKTEGGGAAAVWGCSDFVDAATLGPMNEELVRRLFSGDGLTVGQATKYAKAKIDNLDARRSWLLLGDPTMKL